MFLSLAHVTKHCAFQFPLCWNRTLPFQRAALGLSVMGTQGGCVAALGIHIPLPLRVHTLVLDFMLRAHAAVLLHCRTMAISSPTQGVGAETSQATSVQRDSPLTRSSLITIGVLKAWPLCHGCDCSCVAEGEGDTGSLFMLAQRPEFEF